MNFGDELIARAWLRFLHEHYPNHRVWLDCPNPGRASVLFQDTHPNFHVTDTLWRISWSVDPALGVDEKIARVRELIRNLGTPHEDLGLLMFPHVSLIHFLGGGYLNTIWGSNLLTLVAATELKNKHPHISLIGSGLGLLPMEDGWRERVSILLKEFDFVEARDHQSTDELSVPLGLDDAFLALAQGGIYSRSEQLPDAMLLLQGDFSISTGAMIRTCGWSSAG